MSQWIAGLVRPQAQDDLRLLIDGIPDYGIFMLDPDGLVVTWNSGAERMKGYAANEIIGRHFSTFYPAADVEAGKPAMELRVATETGRFEEKGWRMRKDGSRFWANVIITPMWDEQHAIRGFTKITRDLTAQKRDEERLKQSEERFSLMVASVKDYAIIMLDPQGRVVTWNAGAQRIKGWTEEEIVGKSFEQFYSRAEVEEGKTKRELEVAAERGTFETDGWRVRKDGSRFWANVVITVLRDANGNLRGFANVTRDITERKQAEEKVRKAFEELEGFSYTVAHDLRAPLRSMDGFSDELLHKYEDKLDARGKDYLGRIRRSAQRMARLIDDLLDLSQLGRTTLARGPVDLSALANKAFSELRVAEPRRAVEFSVLPGMLVRADASLMRVVLENLIGNAWKYTSHHATARIEVGMERGTGAPAYFVRDDGAGFDMLYSPKLFGPFQRLHSDDRFKGTGIGLASVKRIIHLHGGEVTAEAEVEKGATFTFTLGA
jgi:PAS domain S-box-containing protein